MVANIVAYIWCCIISHISSCIVYDRQELVKNTWVFEALILIILRWFHRPEQSECWDKAVEIKLSTFVFFDNSAADFALSFSRILCHGCVKLVLRFHPRQFACVKSFAKKFEYEMIKHTWLSSRSYCLWDYILVLVPGWMSDLFTDICMTLCRMSESLQTGGLTSARVILEWLSHFRLVSLQNDWVISDWVTPDRGTHSRLSYSRDWVTPGFGVTSDWLTLDSPSYWIMLHIYRYFCCFGLLCVMRQMFWGKCYLCTSISVLMIG